MSPSLNDCGTHQQEYAISGEGGKVAYIQHFTFLNAARVICRTGRKGLEAGRKIIHKIDIALN